MTMSKQFTTGLSGMAPVLAAARAAAPFALPLATLLATSCAPDREGAPTKNPPPHAAEIFFSTEVVALARWPDGAFSHDERRILVASDQTGTFNAFALPVDGGSPEQLTHAVDGSVFPISWFPKDDRFIYQGDDGGDERTVLRVRELDGSSTALTPTEAVRARFMGWSGDGSAFWVATDKRARPIMDLYRYSADDYERELIFRNDVGYGLEGVSDDGRWIALRRVNSNTDIDLYLYDRVREETIPLSPDVEDVRHRFMAFSSAEGAAYYGTDEFGEFQQVWRFDLASEERTVAEAEAWDVVRFRISPSGRYRIVHTMEDAFPAVRVGDDATGERLSLPSLPVGEPGGGIAFSPSETKVLVAALGTRAPGDLFLVDLTDPRAEPRQLTRILHPAIEPDDLVEATVVRFESPDGVEIPGILYRPRRASHDNPVPALVSLHYGPGGIAFRTWDERLQHLANHGYAVLDLNYRGSDYYGRTFRTLADRRHGEAEVADILAAHDWLAALDWVDGERIGLMGDSFGGFLTLATLAQYPERFAVGIAGHGSVNWISTLTIAAHRLGPAVEAQYAAIGHPERDAERLRRVSPYFHADRVVRPLLMFYGANDPRYDMSEIEEFVTTVRGNGVPVEYLLFEDEGHFLVNRENRIALQEAWLRFLESHLR
jgi:dipeptidyl aminopeptidase/acylaminoacyl peptidase